MSTCTRSCRRMSIERSGYKNRRPAQGTPVFSSRISPTHSGSHRATATRSPCRSLDPPSRARIPLGRSGAQAIPPIPPYALGSQCRQNSRHTWKITSIQGLTPITPVMNPKGIPHQSPGLEQPRVVSNRCNDNPERVVKRPASKSHTIPWKWQLLWASRSHQSPPMIPKPHQHPPWEAGFSLVVWKIGLRRLPNRL